MRTLSILLLTTIGSLCNQTIGENKDQFRAAPYSILRPIQQTEGKFNIVEEATMATNSAFEGKGELRMLHVLSILLLTKTQGRSSIGTIAFYGMLSKTIATNPNGYSFGDQPAESNKRNQDMIVVFDSAARYSKNKTVRVRAISLNGVKGCGGTSKSYAKPEAQNVQVLHIPLTTKINVYQCRVTYTIFTQYCDSNVFLSSIYPKEIYVKDHMFAFSSNDCERFFKTKEAIIILFEKTIVLKDATYNTANKEMTLYGRTYSKKRGDGGCVGIGFTLGDRSFDSTVLSAQITFSVQQRKALFDSTSSMIRVEPNLIEFPMNPEGASCDRDKGCFVYSIDKIPKSMCQRVQQVFRGTGTFFRPKNIDKNDRLAREIVQLKSQDKSQAVTLVIESMDRICGHQVLRTSIRGIYINKIISDYDVVSHDLMMMNGSYEMSQLEGVHLDLLTSLNTGVVASALKNTEKFDEIAKEICEQKRDTLINSIRDILISESAQLLNLKRGLVFRRIGGVSYLYAGPAILAKIRTTEQCFTDIPVEFVRDGELIKMFATSNGRILIENSTQVDCDQEVPIHFVPTLDNDVDLEIETQNSVLGLVDNRPTTTLGSWYCQAPRKFYPCVSPETLNPGSSKSLQFNGITGDILAGSLFGDKGRQQLFRIQTSSHRNKIVNEKLGSLIGDANTDIGIVLVSTITKEGGELLREKIYPTFYWLLGDWLHSFERFVIITIAISMMINIICLTVRTKNLFIRFGFSAKLLIGIVEQFYTLILPLASKGNEGMEKISTLEARMGIFENNLEGFNNVVMQNKFRDMDFGIEENRREITKLGLKLMTIENNIGEFTFARYKELRWRVDALVLGQLNSPRLVGEGNDNQQEGSPFKHLFNLGTGIGEQQYEQLNQGFFHIGKGDDK